MKKALAFSGGKDSWACLWLHEQELSHVHVLWVNAGKNFPELLETIERARAMCPLFYEIRVDQAAQNARKGIPSDIVPVQWTRLGQQFSGPKPVTIQPYITCCFENIGLPLHQFAKGLGVTHLVRGQRLDEGHVSTARNGDVVDGLTYLHPIEQWTSGDVLTFLRSKMELPGHFALEHSSMDCYDCTAYRKHSADRVAYMQEKHPSLYSAYADRMFQVHDALSQALAEG